MQNNIGEARRSYSLKIGHDITQDEAAKMFGVSPSGYKKWEQGVGRLNGGILCAIADKYECSIDYLLRRTEDPTPYIPTICASYNDEEEKRLVAAYRTCNKRGRNTVLDTAETIASCTACACAR